MRCCMSTNADDHRFDKYANKEYVLQLEAEVQKLFPDITLTILSSLVEPYKDTQEAYISRIELPVKGNKEKFIRLEKLGWYKRWTRKIRGHMYRTFDFCYIGFERKQRKCD